MSDAGLDPTLAVVDRALVEVRRERRARRLSVWLLSTAVAAVVLVGAATARNGQADRRRERAEDAAQVQAAIDADFRACARGNAEVRAVLRQLVDATGQGTDLTRVSGFTDLDPAMQRFLRTLAVQSGNSSFRDRVRPLLVDRDCEGEYPRHSPGIRP